MPQLVKSTHQRLNAVSRRSTKGPHEVPGGATEQQINASAPVNRAGEMFWTFCSTSLTLPDCSGKLRSR